MRIAAVTGTNGKTSTVWFARQLLEEAGMPSVSFGTFGLVSKRRHVPEPLCLPGRGGVEVLKESMEAEGAEVGVWEAFSSSLASGVLDALEPSAAALTTLSRDHLNEHHTWERYVEAKEHLFRHVLPAGGVAVLPADLPEGRRFKSIAEERGQQVLLFGRDSRAHVRLQYVEDAPSDTQIAVTIGEEGYTGSVPVIGAFMVDNILAALALVHAAGVDARTLLEGLDKLTPPPGRVEHVATFNGARVYVDYAHTPAALEALLQALRPRTPGRLHLVFGCGGERDCGKRPEMGDIARRLADVVIVTDDNPRYEEPGRIRAAILDACPGACEVANRLEALRITVAALCRGDTMVVAGKGHETVQNVRGECLPFSDREVLQRLPASTLYGCNHRKYTPISN